MRIGGFELPVRWTGSDAEFQGDMAQLPTLLEVATTLAADRCATTIRPTSDQLPFHENFQFHVDRLGRVADALAPAGVKLGLHFLAAPAQRADGGFQFISQVDPLLALVQSLRRDNVGLVLDAWNWTVGGGDVEKIRTLRGEQIVSVLLSDIPAGADLASAAEEQRVLPGEGGMIDCVALVGALEELGYDGPVAVAQHPSLVAGQKREAVVTKASAVLDSVLTAAGIEVEAPRDFAEAK
jgi:sugar phosphate isomerase/epimerase